MQRVRAARQRTSRSLGEELNNLCRRSTELRLGAGDETRTRNLDLGKVLPYHWATPACGLSAVSGLLLAVRTLLFYSD